ncbi:unnamed protein product [Symbiodinium sp. CCMP2592]|nr:unnamed protein product [Symbiodinium sp. CCMP2592]
MDMEGASGTFQDGTWYCKSEYQVSQPTSISHLVGLQEFHLLKSSRTCNYFRDEQAENATKVKAGEGLQSTSTRSETRLPCALLSRMDTSGSGGKTRTWHGLARLRSQTAILKVRGTAILVWRALVKAGILYERAKSQDPRDATLERFLALIFQTAPARSGCRQGSRTVASLECRRASLQYWPGLTATLVAEIQKESWARQKGHDIDGHSGLISLISKGNLNLRIPSWPRFQSVLA